MIKLKQSTTRKTFRKIRGLHDTKHHQLCNVMEGGNFLNSLGVIFEFLCFVLGLRKHNLAPKYPGGLFVLCTAKIRQSRYYSSFVPKKLREIKQHAEWKRHKAINPSIFYQKDRFNSLYTFCIGGLYINISSIATCFGSLKKHKPLDFHNNI